MNSDISGSGKTNLTKHSAIDQRPTWSPNGTRIAFDTNRDGNHEVYSMDANGLALARLTNNPAVDLHGDWGVAAPLGVGGVVDLVVGSGNDPTTASQTARSLELWVTALAVALAVVAGMSRHRYRRRVGLVSHTMDRDAACGF